MGLIKGLHHVKLYCTKEKYEDVLHFYHDVLGIRMLSKLEGSAILDTGSGLIEVFNDAPEPQKMGIVRHFAFAVDDVPEAIRTVEEAGYEIKEYPVDVMFALEKMTPARIAFAWDPLGQEVEFFQYREEEEK